jgi:hypothetical protein
MTYCQADITYVSLPTPSTGTIHQLEYGRLVLLNEGVLLDHYGYGREPREIMLILHISGTSVQSELFFNK